MAKNFPDKYDFKIAESKWQKSWQDNGVYHWRDDKPRAETFVIDTPPPTVSGILHMGHVFSYTQADFIARYQRMSGKDVFYPMGFDDNGLPTERLVEKIRGIRAADKSREEFIQICQEEVVAAEKEFESLFNSIALSVDWRQKYETISDRSRKISQLSFLDLFNKGEVYRKYQPMFWDWVDQTAIAQAEVEEKELPGVQVYIEFGLMDEAAWNGLKGNDNPRPSFDSLEKVQVMTTRPELLGACVALMSHPNNEAKLKGKVAVSPLFNVVVPICFDEKVDLEKGSGFVMCCSWGDDTDKEWINKHDLAWRPLIGLDGKLHVGGSGLVNNTSHDKNIFEILFNAGKDSQDGREKSAISRDNCFNVNKVYEVFAQIIGKKLVRDIKAPTSAKGAVIQLLDAENLLVPTGEKQEKIIHKTQVVKCAERSGSALEIIPTFQWFVKLVDKKDELSNKINECKWYPEYMKVRAEQWNESLNQDWCISRQRYFGVPFPVWFSQRAGEEGKILVADAADLPVNPLVDLPRGYSKDEVIADADVMDTWATSSVSPQLSAWGIAGDGEFVLDQNRYSKLFPADLRPQAHEIIRTWAYYTIAKAHLHEKKIPWKNVMISGWCLAEDKSKMSKSKGNVVTPVPLVEAKSSDVVRYWASTSSLGADTAYSEDVLKIGNKLVNKLWNACKFAAINLDKLEGAPDASKVTETIDKWVITRLNKTIREATENFEAFEYSKARVAVEEFFWKDFCDNYLEFIKTRSYDEKGENPAGQQSALNTVAICIDGILRLWAPFVPHITEELYSIIFESKQSIHSRGNWPLANLPEDEASEKAGIEAVAILEEVRKAKSEKGVSIKFPVKSLEIKSPLELSGVEADLKSVTSAESLHIAKGEFSVVTTLGEQAAA